MSGLPPIAAPSLASIGRPTQPLGIEGGAAGGAVADKGDLAGSFTHALAEAHGLETTAQTSAERFAAGDPDMGIHEVMIASEKANIAVRYATTLKNKALEAYKDLMNTQV